MKKKSYSRSSATDCSTKNYGSLLAKARDVWLESPEGKLCLNVEILSSPSQAQYLKNRLERAFIAGADAAKKFHS